MGSLHRYTKGETPRHQDVNELVDVAERGDTLSVGQGLRHTKTTFGHHVSLEEPIAPLDYLQSFWALVVRAPEEGDKTILVREVTWAVGLPGDGVPQIQAGQYKFRGPNREAIPTIGYLPKDYRDIARDPGTGGIVAEDSFIHVEFAGLFYEAGPPPPDAVEGFERIAVVVRSVAPTHAIVAQRVLYANPAAPVPGEYVWGFPYIVWPDIGAIGTDYVPYISQDDPATIDTPILRAFSRGSTWYLAMPSEGGGAAELNAFLVEAVGLDTLLATRIGAPDTSVVIAKPMHLRRSAWVGEPIWHSTLEQFITYQYTAETGAWKRIAVMENERRYIEVIHPQYRDITEGDLQRRLIWAAKLGSNHTQQPGADWLDANVDGRAFTTLKELLPGDGS